MKFYKGAKYRLMYSTHGYPATEVFVAPVTRKANKNITLVAPHGEGRFTLPVHALEPVPSRDINDDAKDDPDDDMDGDESYPDGWGGWKYNDDGTEKELGIVVGQKYRITKEQPQGLEMPAFRVGDVVEAVYAYPRGEWFLGRNNFSGARHHVKTMDVEPIEDKPVEDEQAATKKMIELDPEDPIIQEFLRVYGGIGFNAAGKLAEAIRSQITPRMEEPTELGSVVDSDYGPMVRARDGETTTVWYSTINAAWYTWSTIPNPHPLTK